jgi:hypothetical protein
MTSPTQSSGQEKSQGGKLPERGTAEAAPREQDAPNTAAGKGASSEGKKPIQERNRGSSKV